uniref:Uncharacterized protein n=1 Tax=Glossina palpalis gambiensis TaxID=67801 RepID=A0A1B0BQK2_9MUSC
MPTYRSLYFERDNMKAVESIEEYSAYFEEHTKVIKSTTQTTEHLVNGRSETTYRAVAFEKFPVPTTGGIVVDLQSLLLERPRNIIQGKRLTFLKSTFSCTFVANSSPQALISIKTLRNHYDDDGDNDRCGIVSTNTLINVALFIASAPMMMMRFYFKFATCTCELKF